jgi:hypothetical protein
LRAFKRSDSSASNSVAAGHGLSSGAIAGIVIGVIVILMFIAGVCLVLFRRQKARSVKDDDEKKFPRHVELTDMKPYASPLPSEVWTPGKHGRIIDPVEIDGAAINELYGSSVEGSNWSEPRVRK